MQAVFSDSKISSLLRPSYPRKQWFTRVKKKFLDYRERFLAPKTKNQAQLDRDTHRKNTHVFCHVDLYEITCIPSNTDKPDTDSNVGLWVLI